MEAQEFHQHRLSGGKVDVTRGGRIVVTRGRKSRQVALQQDRCTAQLVAAPAFWDYREGAERDDEDRRLAID